jgi:hypothetical protein
MIKNKEDAKKALQEVQGNQCFYVCDGQVLKSLKELGKALKAMKPEVYGFHVTESKNDFSNWVNDIFGDSKLAKDIYSVSKAKATTVIGYRIKELEKKSI